MKKFLCAFLVISFLWTNHTSLKVEASNDYNADLENYIVDDEYQIVENNLAVFGNQQNFSQKDFLNIVDLGGDKIYLNYRTDNEINLPYDLFVVVKNDGKTFNYEYRMAELNEDDLLENIKIYLRRNNNEILNAYNQTYNIVTASINSSVPTTFIDAVATANITVDFAPYGYVVSRIAFSEYEANNQNSLFIAKVISTFVPGYVAYNNGLTNYAGYLNASGYTHITLEQAYDKNDEINGIRYGATPYFKDYWPVNNPATVTISSSTQQGVSYGLSTKDGFSIGGNISYGYSKSITTTEPQVSAQLAPNLKEAQWSYAFNTKGNFSFDQESNYMYEIGKTGNNMMFGDVRLKIDYKIVFAIYISNFGGIMLPVKEAEHSLDLMVRPSNGRIWDFSNGMI